MPENNLNIEHICRENAFVEALNKPYDERIFHINQKLSTCYENSFFSDNQRKIKKIIGELEQISLEEEKSSRNFFKNILPKHYDFKEDLKKLGSRLSKSMNKLKSFSEALNKGYNESSKKVYEFSKGVEQLHQFIEDSERKKQKLGEDIICLHNLHNNPIELDSYLNKLIEKKAESETTSFSEEEKEKIKSFFILKGEEELQRLSENYLKIQNDVPIAKKTLSYADKIEKYNELSDSFEAAKNRVGEEIRKAQEILILYDFLTKRELEFLSELKLPENYVNSINTLAQRIEETDKRFSDSVLELIFNTNSLISEPQLSEVAHGLVSYLKQKESK